jgi:hypothetical protein
MLNPENVRSGPASKFQRWSNFTAEDGPKGSFLRSKDCWVLWVLESVRGRPWSREVLDWSRLTELPILDDRQYLFLEGISN